MDNLLAIHPAPCISLIFFAMITLVKLSLQIKIHVSKRIKTTPSLLFFNIKMINDQSVNEIESGDQSSNAMPVTKIMQTKIYSGCKKIDKCYCYAITARVIALLNHVKISPAFLYTRVDTEILLNTDIFAEDFGDRTFFCGKFLS